MPVPITVIWLYQLHQIREHDTRIAIIAIIVLAWHNLSSLPKRCHRFRITSSLMPTYCRVVTATVHRWRSSQIIPHTIDCEKRWMNHNCPPNWHVIPELIFADNKQYFRKQCEKDSEPKWPRDGTSIMNIFLWRSIVLRMISDLILKYAPQTIYKLRNILTEIKLLIQFIRVNFVFLYRRSIWIILLEITYVDLKTWNIYLKIIVQIVLCYTCR